MSHIPAPNSVVHVAHIGYDENQGTFTGVCSSWTDTLSQREGTGVEKEITTESKVASPAATPNGRHCQTNTTPAPSLSSFPPSGNAATTSPPSFPPSPLPLARPLVHDIHFRLSPPAPPRPVSLRPPI
ncbi:hypothetical protein B0H12DRAFT_1233343 [Mycena haematopus]|nr:hypothetical protein B0H12DRAFT_1233343 [Mycena haematopus]